MEDNTELIQEANIIPVINVENSTPLTEHSDFSINFDHFKTSFNRDEYEPEKSSLTHKVFEKLSDSLSAIGKSIRSSLESTNVSESSDLAPEENVDDIDVVGTSPGNEFIAAWSSENGILAVFKMDKYCPTHIIFGVKTPFDKTNVSKKNARIFISVSEDGLFVAISRITILKEHNADTPNMDAAVNSDGLDKSDDSPQSSFVVYSTKNNKKYDGSVLYAIDIIGPLIFVYHNKLVCLSNNIMYLISTKSWSIQSSVVIEALVRSAPNYSNTSNEYILSIYNHLVESLKYGYIVWPEAKCGVSVWNLKGILRQWFYVDTKSISRSKNIFIISPRGDLVARFHEKGKSGLLYIFHTPTGLQVSKIDVPKSTFFISFLNKTDQIILCSQKEEGVGVQLLDCWSGLIVFEEKWTYLNHNKPLLLIGDRFLQAVGNELLTYSLFPNNSPSVVMEALFRTTAGCKTKNNGLVIITTLEKFHETIQCWGHILNDDDDLLCKFMFEPWHHWNNNDIFIHWLDSEGKRFVMVGKDSVQIYKTRRKSNQKYIQVDLQYIWISNVDDIKLVTLETRGETELEKILLHVQLSNNENVTLPLPEEDEKATYRVITDACAAIHYLRLQYTDDIEYFGRLLIKGQLKKLIESSIQSFPSVFNKISLGNDAYVYPMEDFILLGWDDIVKSIIEANRYIPLFHNEEQTESALLLLVELQKSELVELMVNYIMKHLKNRPTRNNSKTSKFDDLTNIVVQQPGFAWTLGKALLDLYQYYPDKGIYVMKESSYFTTSLEAPTRILQTKLGNPSFKSEERSFFNELRSVTRKARLPKGEKYREKYREKRRLFSEWFRGLDLFQINFDDKLRHETGALVYYPEGTNYSDKRQTMKDTYGARQKLRKQRLEDAKKTHPAKLCVVPWPDFCVYPPPQSGRFLSLSENIYRLWGTYFSPVQRSPFADIALNGTSEMFSSVAMEAVIKFKW